MKQPAPTTFFGRTLVGPFPADERPERSGLYPRVSPKTGTLNFAWYDARSDRWALFTTEPEDAMRKARQGKWSKKACSWYGFEHDAKALYPADPTAPFDRALLGE